MQRVYRGYPITLHTQGMDQTPGSRGAGGENRADGQFPPEFAPMKTEGRQPGFGPARSGEEPVTAGTPETAFFGSQTICHAEVPGMQNAGAWGTPPPAAPPYAGQGRPASAQEPLAAPPSATQEPPAVEPSAAPPPATQEPPAAHPLPTVWQPEGNQLRPYMFYRGNEQEELVERPQALRMEFDYFKSMYPLSARRGQVLVEEVSDHMDFPGSPIYDEFPDWVTILRMRDQVGRNAKAGGQELDMDLAQILLVNEIGRRRILRKF